MKKEEIETLNKIKNGKIQDLEIILSKSKKQKLLQSQLLELLKQIKNTRTTKNKKYLLWRIALTNNPIEEILEFSKENVSTITNEEEYPLISDDLRFSLHYSISKSNKKDFEKIISKLLKSKSGEIRLIIAEHFFEKNQPEKALCIIIEILDSLNIDHNVSDAIELDIAHYTNIQILENLRIKYKENEKNISKSVKYIISIMETKILQMQNHDVSAQD